MKRLALVIVCLSALALPAASLAAERPDAAAAAAAFQARLEQARANAASFVARCNVAQPPPRCAVVRAKTLARLHAWEAAIRARIAAVEQRPESVQRSAVLARLNARVAQVAALAARLQSR